MLLNLIRFFPPETAHFLTINLLKLGVTGFFTKSFQNDKILNQFIWNLEFSNPVGLAAGFDKNAEVIEPLLAMGFGFVEIGYCYTKTTIW